MAWLNRLRLASPSMKPTRPDFLSTTRRYGSAAALALDYDTDEDYYNEKEEKVRQPRLMLGSTGSAPERGVQWVLIGEPGARRHMYAQRLSKLLEVPHISMDSLVRQELNPRSPLHKLIANAVNEGKIVPEDVIFALLSKRLEEGYNRGETGFILDGIPRTRNQAEILDEIEDIDLVVNLKCTRKHMVNNSFSDNSCQGYFSMTNSSLSTSVINSAYAEQVNPLEEYYKNQRKLVNFQQGDAPGESWEGLLAALHLQDVNAATTASQKLTA